MSEYRGLFVDILFITSGGVWVYGDDAVASFLNCIMNIIGGGIRPRSHLALKLNGFRGLSIQLSIRILLNMSPSIYLAYSLEKETKFNMDCKKTSIFPFL